MVLAEKLLTTRHGVSFQRCLMECIGNQELVENYDRLHGANLSQKGNGLELAVDKASGRQETEFRYFVEFCWEYIFTRFGGRDRNANHSAPLAQIRTGAANASGSYLECLAFLSRPKETHNDR